MQNICEYIDTSRWEILQRKKHVCLSKVGIIYDQMYSIYLSVASGACMMSHYSYSAIVLQFLSPIVYIAYIGYVVPIPGTSFIY